ncbi:MAG: DUF2141 domain-containing protein [Pseudomonadota bacterium]
MKTRVTRGALWCSVLALTAMLLPARAQAAAACDGSAAQARLTVRITGVANTKGNLTITVYPDDADRFLAKGGKLLRARVPVVVPLTESCFALPVAGSYAIAVYHDANNDHDFNRTFVGMPAEGYGFSNNPVTKLGLPGFKEVRFAAKAGDNPVYIKLTY